VHIAAQRSYASGDDHHKQEVLSCTIHIHRDARSWRFTIGGLPLFSAAEHKDFAGNVASHQSLRSTVMLAPENWNARINRAELRFNGMFRNRVLLTGIVFVNLFATRPGKL
jgi:hypothetical protein